MVGFGEVDVVGGGDEVGDYDFRDGSVVIFFELDVVVGDDIEEFGVEFVVFCESS